MTYRLIFISFCAFTFSYSHTQKQSPLDLAIDRLKKEKPYLFTNNPEISAKKNDLSFNYENAYCALDIATLIAALGKIGYEYRNIYWLNCHDNLNTNVAWRSLYWLIGPSLTQSLNKLGKHALLTKLVMIISLELVFYKTILKTVLFCAHADLFDIVEQAAIRTRKLIKSILF